MTLFLYKSVLCPRCYLAERYLKEIIGGQPELTVETIDIATSFARFRQDGISMIPTLRIGDKTLTMIIPSRKLIRDFLESNQLL